MWTLLTVILVALIVLALFRNLAKLIIPIILVYLVLLFFFVWSGEDIKQKLRLDKIFTDEAQVYVDKTLEAKDDFTNASKKVIRQEAFDEMENKKDSIFHDLKEKTLPFMKNGIESENVKLLELKTKWTLALNNLPKEERIRVIDEQEDTLLYLFTKTELDQFKQKD